MSFRLVSYNIRRGGAGRENDLVAVISALRPDLVVLQEATKPAVVEALAARCGMAEWGAQARTSLGYLSRRPTSHHGWHHPRFSRHAVLEVHPGGAGFPVFGVHLSAVHAAWTERRRAMELAALLRTIRAHQGGFHVLTGDFNTLAPGELLEIRKLPRRLRALVWLSGGRIRWRTIQLVLNAGYADGYRHLHPGETGLTFPVWDPHVRLDYVFVPAGSTDRLTACEVVRDPRTRRASDHFPLLAVIDGQRP